jgi:hypothetical protein
MTCAEVTLSTPSGRGWCHCSGRANRQVCRTGLKEKNEGPACVLIDVSESKLGVWMFKEEVAYGPWHFRNVSDLF